jgi:hypothetical protein
MMMNPVQQSIRSILRFDLSSAKGSAVIPMVLALAFLILSMTVGLGYSHQRSASSVRLLEESIFAHHLRELAIQDVLSQLNQRAISNTEELYRTKISDFNGYQVLPVELKSDAIDLVSMTILVRIPGKSGVSDRKWRVVLKQTTSTWSVFKIEEVY